MQMNVGVIIMTIVGMLVSLPLCDFDAPCVWALLWRRLMLVHKLFCSFVVQVEQCSRINVRQLYGGQQT